MKKDTVYFVTEIARIIIDIGNRSYNKEGCYNIVFAGNSIPGAWKDKLNDNDSLLCSLEFNSLDGSFMFANLILAQTYLSLNTRLYFK